MASFTRWWITSTSRRGTGEEWYRPNCASSAPERLSITGSVQDRVERAVLDEREMEYLYKDGTDHYFMDTENYEQIHFSEEVLGDAVNYLVANSKIKVEFYDGKALGVELPTTIDLRVVETEPGMPSATVSNVLKPAKLETGLVVGVPHFVQEGDVIRVDTTEGKYIERVRG